MKILYSAGNRASAGVQLKRFLTHANKHEVRIAAYSLAIQFVPFIDWTLDALQTRNSFKKKEVNDLFEHTGVPNINLESAEQFLDDLSEWMPDIIISDGEPIAAHAAHTLGIELWYCSPLHLLDGVIWEYSKSLYKKELDKTLLQLQAMPAAEKYLVYSPFGDVANFPLLANGYEWTTPYIKDLKEFRCADLNRCQSPGIERFKKQFSNGFFCAGETSYIADAFYRNNPVYISPSMTDPEGLLNALFAEQYNVGVDLGSIDNDRYAIRCLKNMPTLPNLELDIQNFPKLHEILEKI